MDVTSYHRLISKGARSATIGFILEKRCMSELQVARPIMVEQAIWEIDTKCRFFLGVWSFLFFFFIFEK